MAHCHVFCHHQHPPPPLSMNLCEKAPKEGLGLVNGGRLHQLLHPNEAALSFTKPQLITLQVISKQDCFSFSSPQPTPYFNHNQQDGDETLGREGSQRPRCFTLVISLTHMIRMALIGLRREGKRVDTTGAGLAGFTGPQLGRTEEPPSSCRSIVY